MILNEIEKMELESLAEKLSLDLMQLQEDFEKFNSMIDILVSLGVSEIDASDFVARHWQSITLKDCKYRNIKFKN